MTDNNKIQVSIDYVQDLNDLFKVHQKAIIEWVGPHIGHDVVILERITAIHNFDGIQILDDEKITVLVGPWADQYTDETQLHCATCGVSFDLWNDVLTYKD